MKIKYPNIPIGTKVNFLKIIGEPKRVRTIGKNGAINFRLLYPCECVCGAKTHVRAYCLRRKITFSCGCQKKPIGNNISKKASKENITNHPLHIIYCGIKARCYTKSDGGYRYYGGRGITVCDRWINSFEDFVKDVGERPSPKHSIDRIDVNGNYEPSNFRWATYKEQANNKRNNKKIKSNC